MSPRGVAKHELEDLWVQIDAIVVSAPVIRSAGHLAEHDRLRGYDAVHLAAALSAGATVFATADDRLLDAARRHGMGVANPLELPN